MNRSLSSIRDDIRSLSANEREMLLCEMIADLDPDTDSDAEAAWLAEANRRLAEIDSGSVELVPAAEAFDRIREQLAK